MPPAAWAALLGLSLGLRLWGLGWGIPAYDPAILGHTLDRPSYHLDEDKFLWPLAYMRWQASDWDVRDYHWGTLQFYLIDGVLLLSSSVHLIPAPWELAFVGGDTAALPRIYLLGRLISVVAGVLTTVLVVALGREVAGPAAGWAAGVAYALAPLAVVEAHYLTSDVTMSALVAGATLAAVRALGRGSPRLLALAGLLLGLAITAKYSAVFAAPGLLVASWSCWRAWRSAETRRVPLVGCGNPQGSPCGLRKPTGFPLWVAEYGELYTAGGRLRAAFIWPGLALVGGVVLGEPAVLLMPGAVWQGLRSVAASNAAPLPTLPVAAAGMLAQQVPALAGLGLTWPLAGLACGGLGLFVRAAWVGRPHPTNGAPAGTARAPAAVLLVTAGGLLAGVAVNTYAMLRYTQPLIPLLAVAAGVAWAAIPSRAVRGILGVGAIAGASVISGGQLALLAGPHPANALQAWVSTQVPPGRQIARAWLPYPMIDEARYRVIRLEPWRPALPPATEPDYIVADDMMGAPAPELTALLATRYHVVAQFAATPHLGPWSWAEGPTPHDWKYSHPSFVVYAHR